MPNVLNKYHGNIPKNAVNIMRPSKWGNPYKIGRDGNRDEVVKKFITYLLTNQKLMADLHELKGKDLVCCCSPQLCHGHVLKFYANEEFNDA